MLPDLFHNYFTLNSSIHDYNTRNVNNIHPPLNRVSITQSSTFYKGTVLWNNLNIDIKSSKTLRQFKRLYKQILFDTIYHQYNS